VEVELLPPGGPQPSGTPIIQTHVIPDEPEIGHQTAGWGVLVGGGQTWYISQQTTSFNSGGSSESTTDLQQWQTQPGDLGYGPPHVPADATQLTFR
jgi:hypothetical protein